ncbi:MAG: serine hydrolase domain-containing protein [Myxococcota bacterium]|nr:serine hydrolase domain-containing protein [Myxococcota bacterium]
MRPLSEVRQLLEESVQAGVFSGAVLRIEDLAGEGSLAVWPVGSVSSSPSGPPVEASTLFDLASVTKLFSVTATLRLVAAGVLALDDSLRLLLEHRSGLPAWQPYFQTGDVLRSALAEPRINEPGSVHLYSDVGFLHLLDRIQQATGKGIETVVKEEVLEPLGLASTHYRDVGLGPPEQLTSSMCATEHCPRRGFLVGEVSDGNTWAMGGRSTHAGLFAPAADLAGFARGWWDAPETGFLPGELRDAAWAEPPEPGTHVLGWDTVSPGESSVGTRLSRRSHGHLGFTGTSLWVDPDRAIAVVLLTNRVHPSRDDNRIKELRPRIHDLAADFVDSLR